jgi:hypothetical protein
MMMLETLQSYQPNVFGHDAPVFILWNSPHAWAERNIFFDAQPIEQGGVALKDHGAVDSRAFNRRSIQENLA